MDGQQRSWGCCRSSFIICALIGEGVLRFTHLAAVYATGSNTTAASWLGPRAAPDVGRVHGRRAVPELPPCCWAPGFIQPVGFEPGFELRVIATVVLGGTRLAGGRGGMLGTVAAAIIATLANVLNFFHADASGKTWLRVLCCWLPCRPRNPAAGRERMSAASDFEHVRRFGPRSARKRSQKIPSSRCAQAQLLSIRTFTQRVKHVSQKVLGLLVLYRCHSLDCLRRPGAPAANAKKDRFLRVRHTVRLLPGYEGHERKQRRRADYVRGSESSRPPWSRPRKT
jgi:hypothetical protein